MSQETQLSTEVDYSNVPASLDEQFVRDSLNTWREQEAGMAYGTQALRAKLKEDNLGVYAGKDNLVESYNKKKPLVAQVVCSVPARALRAKGFIAKVEDDPKPICVSTDGGNHGTVDLLQIGKYGVTKLRNGQLCATCAYGGKGAWGTAIDANTGQPGKGKACREMRHLLLLVKDLTVPVILTVSPSSLTAWDGYRTLFKAKGDDYFRFWSRIAPVLVTAPGRSYGTLTFEEVEPVSMEQFMAAKTLREDFLPTLYDITDDVNQEDAEPAGNVIDHEPRDPNEAEDIPFE